MTAALILWPYAPHLHPGSLEVTAIDVGQGDSIFFASPDGKTMLIDAGGFVGSTWNPTLTTYDIGEEVVSPYLWSRGLRHLDIVALTHAHNDHLGGMGAVLRNFRPQELWVRVDATTPDFLELLHTADTLHIKVRHLRAGDRQVLGSTPVAILAPAPSYTPVNEPINDDSLVMRLTYGHATALLEGDAERITEDQMLRRGLLQHVTLLKAGHHGSLTSTNPEFVAAVTPQAAIISSGKGNTFGHPRFEVLETLQSAHAKVYRTDTMGAVTFLLQSDGSIEAAAAASQP